MADEIYIAYCLKCKSKKTIKNPVITTMKTGMNAVKGECPDCGCKMFKILPKTKA